MISPQLAARRLQVVQNRVELNFGLARRMVEHAQFELASGRTVETRVLVCRAIDQLDRALTVIWEHEQVAPK